MTVRLPRRTGICTARAGVAALLAVAAMAALAATATAPPATGTEARKPGPSATARSRDGARAAPAAPAAATAAKPRDPRRLKTEQQQLQSQLARVKRSLATAEARHSEAADALAASESAISEANRRLREMRADRTAVERQILSVRERQLAAAANQSQEEAQLTRLMRGQWARSRESDLQVLLRGDDPVSTHRSAAYLRYVSLAKSQSIGALQDRREELAALEAEARDRQDELRRIGDEERRHRAELVAGQAERKRQVTRLGREIGRHRDTVAALERDDRRLSGLIEQLARERVTRSERPATAKAPVPAGREPVPPVGAAVALPTTGRFAQLRGRLPLPVTGQIAARFGSARSAEGGSATWKGVLLQAPEGSEVRSVAAGRVVFADWLRGFGNLLIVDHGEGFLTVYGYNESLLKALGEKVEAGDVIATVGDTGGSGNSGRSALYFEARYEGRPFDPLLWTASR